MSSRLPEASQAREEAALDSAQISFASYPASVAAAVSRTSLPLATEAAFFTLARAFVVQPAVGGSASRRPASAKGCSRSDALGRGKLTNRSATAARTPTAARPPSQSAARFNCWIMRSASAARRS
jgi:hypothetical protein